MKEMLGGCCVCSDERGWTENPLVYCDGTGCNVAVHQACYGIVQVPTGPWYCRKCESQERTARVRCELCPSRDGALKRTDTAGWAHVVCALYIPEVRFGNVTTMEPIVLEMVPQDRYHKSCSLCGDSSHATLGACMQCNKSGCKQYFHVTCAQAAGLLCEEAGNYMDNVKYCGYCQHHYQKLVSLKKDSNIKTIPAFKPPASTVFSDDDSDAPPPTSTRGRKPVQKTKKPIYTSDSSADDEPTLKTPPKRAAKEKPTVYDDPEFDDDSTGAKAKFESKTREELKAATAKPKRSSEKSLPAIMSMYDSLTKNSAQKKSQVSVKRPSKEKDSKDKDNGAPAVKRPKTPTSTAANNSSLTKSNVPTSSSHNHCKSEGSSVRTAVNGSSEPKDSRPLWGPKRPQRPKLPQAPPPTNFPTTLEQLLERQWDQGSTFLMKQAQHFDIAALLSCLHQLKSENSTLEDKILALTARKDHLLAVNARLSVPLGMLNAAPSAMPGMPSAASNGLPAVASVTAMESRITPPRAENGNATNVEKERSMGVAPPPPPPTHHGFVGVISESAAAAMAANGRLPTLPNYNYASQHKSKR